MTRKLAHLYDRWSSRYDEDENRTRDLAARLLRERIAGDGTMTVVELGCGTGANTRWLAERAGLVVGVDLSEGMLRRARERREGSGYHLVRQDLSQPLPFAEGCADRVVVTLVLEHLPSILPVVAEAARILAPEGRIVICEYHPHRQLAGGGARFRDEAGEEITVPAHHHAVSEHLEAGLRGGLELLQLDERRHPDDEGASPPRIVLLEWRGRRGLPEDAPD